MGIRKLNTRLSIMTLFQINVLIERELKYSKLWLEHHQGSVHGWYFLKCSMILKTYQIDCQIQYFNDSHFGKKFLSYQNLYKHLDLIYFSFLFTVLLYPVSSLCFIKQKYYCSATILFPYLSEVYSNITLH